MVLGVAGDGLFGGEDEQTLARFIQQTRVTFPVVRGAESRAEYGDAKARISPFPFDVIIDRNGTVRYMATKFDAQAMMRVVDGLLDAPAAQ